MFSTTKVCKGLALAFGSLFVMVTSASAQQPATQLERVEITGSNIKRIDAETASPIQIISREEIRRTGASSIRELIDSLPAASPTSLSDISGSNSFASGASSASLRNLGKQSTLILLNFRRVSPYALADYNEVFTNLDALPLDAVERVEILRSGASAIYGSDAVAGVINIITRRDYQGLQAQASYQGSLTSRGSFTQSTASITGGFGNMATDKFNVLANLELFKRDNVIWRDVLDKMNPVTKAFIPRTLTAQYSTFSYPGNLVGVGPIPGCPPELLISNLCRYDRYQRFEAMPAAERTNLLVSGRLAINPSLEGFAEALWSRTDTTYLSPYQPYGPQVGTTTWGDPTTGAGRTFVPRGLPAGHPLNPSGADANDFRYRFTDAPSEGNPISDNYRFLLGLRGTLGAWDWESAIGFLGAKTKDISRGRFSDSGFREVIGDYDLPGAIQADFFNKPGGYRIGEVNSAAVVDRLFPGYGANAKTSQTVLDGKVSGELMPMAAGPLTVAAGFDVRREKLTIKPTDNLLAGDIVGVGNAATDASRSFGALFGELSIPITRTLEAQVAARLDKFPGFDAQLSPKLGLRYQPTRELLLRGTIDSGFRAPNLTESAQSTKFAFSNGVTDPQRCPQAQALSTDLRAQAAALPANDPNAALLDARADIVEQNECSAGVANIASSNPNLKPEVSRSLSLGFVLEPTPGLSFSLDYWNIKRRDEIGIKSTQELLAAEGNLPAGSQIARDGLGVDNSFTPAEQAQYGVTVGQLSSLTNVFENVSKTKTSGFDIGVNTSTPLSFGKLDVSVQATYLHTYRSFSTVINTFGDNLAGRYQFPRWSAAMTAALSSGPWVNGMRVRHSGSTKLDGDYFDTGYCEFFGLSADCRVSSGTMFDYFFSYKGVKNLTVSAYVRNVFNQLPPADIRKLFEDGGFVIPQTYEDAQRRTLKLTVEYKFF